MAREPHLVLHGNRAFWGGNHNYIVTIHLPLSLQKSRPNKFTPVPTKLSLCYRCQGWDCCREHTPQPPVLFSAAQSFPFTHPRSGAKGKAGNGKIMPGFWGMEGCGGPGAALECKNPKPGVGLSPLLSQHGSVGMSWSPPCSVTAPGMLLPRHHPIPQPVQ